MSGSMALADELGKRIKKIIREEEQTGERFRINKEINALSFLREPILKEKQWELMHSNNDLIVIQKQQRLKQENKQRFQKLLACLPDDGTGSSDPG
jgi:hypothetical protein